MTPHPFCLESLTASIDSEMVPIWFTLRSRQLADPCSMACWILMGLVTVRSSPTICTFSPTAAVILFQLSQSSWSKGSSIVTIGYSSIIFLYKAVNSSPESNRSVFFSGPVVLKSRSYWFFPGTLNSEEATSRPIETLSRYPALSVASISIARPDSASQGGAKPPSSPIRVASPPNFSLITALRLWKTSHPIIIDSVNVSAPVGIIKNSWNASLFPA
mmetsp:Transcript_4498/g.8028  ORF Transcript_4498/g.8028 Transcript_4498/m.8028 type:complete len:217 (+) Transcript_4498:420-1070(+)